MEQVDAELSGWQPAPYGTKAEVDASFKALLDRCLDASARGGLLVGVASHNLFDVGWALAQRRHRGLERGVEIEMLEGMAPPQARATLARRRPLVLYTPVVTRTTSPRASPTCRGGSTRTRGRRTSSARCSRSRPARPAWHAEQRRFEPPSPGAARLDGAPPRAGPAPEVRRFDPEEPFANEPDTDFTQAANREWIAPAPGEGAPGRAAAARDDDGRHRRARRAGARRRRRGGERDARASGAGRSPASPR